MRVLLSTIGSRGDFQPLLAVGLQLREFGHDVLLCAPPDFLGLSESHGLPFVPVGPELHSGAARSATRPSLEDLRKLVPATVAAQFETLRQAADGCQVIVACNQLQVAARSVSELCGIRYVFADFSPVSLPSPHHPPPRLPGPPPDPEADNRTLWQQEIERRNTTWRAALNQQRAAIGLDPVEDVHGHILGDRPLLAADPALAPWPTPSELQVMQTGAWMLVDRRPLAPALQEFLAAGEPPIYFGFGSVPLTKADGRLMIESARALGRRCVVLRGWSELDLVDDAPDCLFVTETNQQSLFPHVAAVVQHGGAGTTTTAARAGTPQVILPHHYDQYYFAQRVQRLGIGCAHPEVEPTVASIAGALQAVLRSEVTARARSFARDMRTDGALIAAEYVLAPSAP